MIRYALACDSGHDFESWFPSGASFDAQRARGLVECPVCGSTAVEKQLMAPALGRAAKRARDEAPVKPVETAVTAEAQVPETPAPPRSLALLSEREQAVRAMLKAVREHVVKNSDYVGTSFADQARKMHYGEIEHRSIYGEANGAETKALIEEGIEVQPLPGVPDDRN